MGDGDWTVTVAQTLTPSNRSLFAGLLSRNKISDGKGDRRLEEGRITVTLTHWVEMQQAFTCSRVERAIAKVERANKKPNNGASLRKRCVRQQSRSLYRFDAVHEKQRIRRIHENKRRQFREEDRVHKDTKGCLQHKVGENNGRAHRRSGLRRPVRERSPFTALH
ncbi:hypothetical protein EVAR_93200_1 [Eumeta japonica]|uniref:Uncharacterized protein n=1 Tax=Eumeta variegata TaxID=151549 RepID=A0A4C1TXK1_EUMVA|nr:hypothetical protein EVAR_93200_1 [Eumeta japonica]